MAIRKMSLKSVYEKARSEYEARGYGADSWQWNDEGKVYAIQDYLSMCGELDNADWEFARHEGIEEECKRLSEDEE